jgi:DnaA regulatory inactivator Hda
MTQYTLSLPLPTLFSEDNFIVSDCNKEAWQWIQTWPSHALLLYGPSGCGKSHLGYIWAQRTSALTTPANVLDQIDLSKVAMGNWLIEDIEELHNERTLLHMYNAIKEQGGNLLITSALPAAQLPFTLPDLTSRLLALPSANIQQPDDAVLAGAMRKQFTDRQMKVDDEVIDYILPRIERSFKKIQELVEYIDRSALAAHKNITIPFVKRMLDAWQNTPLL